MKETMRGLNQGNIQNLNRSLLLNLLRREKVCARTTIGRTFWSKAGNSYTYYQ